MAREKAGGQAWHGWVHMCQTTITMASSDRLTCYSLNKLQSQSSPMSLALSPEFWLWPLAEAPVTDTACKWTKIPGASQLAPGKYELDVKNTGMEIMLGMGWSKMKWRKCKAVEQCLEAIPVTPQLDCIFLEVILIFSFARSGSSVNEPLLERFWFR